MDCMTTIVSITQTEDTSGCEHSCLMPLPNEPAVMDAEQEGRLKQGRCAFCGNIVTVELKDGTRTGRSWLQVRTMQS